MKPAFPNMRNFDQHIKLKHKPNNDLERQALGSFLKIVQPGAYKCLSNVVTVDNYTVLEFKW